MDELFSLAEMLGIFLSCILKLLGCSYATHTVHLSQCIEPVKFSFSELTESFCIDGHSGIEGKGASAKNGCEAQE